MNGIVAGIDHEQLLFRSDRDALYKEMALLMKERFKGNNWRMPQQTNNNIWYPYNNTLWLQSLQEHLHHRKTIGIYPLDEHRRVSTLAIDIDRHDDSVTEWDLVQEKLLPILHWYTRLGVRDNQMLIENSGMGFHVWFWLKDPVPADYAVAFLSGAKEEYGAEIFPNSPNPPDLGNLIRLPCGVHRQRHREKLDGAQSWLCDIRYGMVEPLYAPKECLDLMIAWQPLRMDQLIACDMDKKYDHPILEQGLVVTVSPRLQMIRDNEERECFRMILTHKTLDGERNNVNFWLGLYLKNILKLEASEVMNLLTDWNNCLTEPKLSWNELKHNVESALSYNGWPTCNRGKHREICLKHGLWEHCRFHNNRTGPLPIPDKSKYIELKKGKSALSKIELALHHLTRNKGVHPERGKGWIKTTYQELGESAGISKFTVQNRRSNEPHKGLTPLQVLAMQGRIEYESEKGSKFLWIRLLKR